MQKNNIQIVLLSTIILFLLVVIITTFSGICHSKSGKNYFLSYRCIVGIITKIVIIEKPLPANFSTKVSEKTTVIYVLGGNQESLTSRFRKASDLYHQGISKKIMILSRPGITEFSPTLGRNLTNDEWAIRELEILQVNKEDIEPVCVQRGVFGTLSEAQVLTETVQKRGYKMLILVSSAYHTRRVYNTFSVFATGRPLELSIYGTNDTTEFPSLALEYLKLLLYDTVVLPANNWKRTGSRGNLLLCSVDSARGI